MPRRKSRHLTRRSTPQETSTRRDSRSSSSTSDAPTDPKYAVSVYAGLSLLLFNEKFSDMTITCGGREFKAHRAVVCTQSSFFDKAFTGSFREATSRTIDLPEDDPEVLERFLRFLYTGSYSEDKPDSAAMLGPDDIQDALRFQPGVGYQGSDTERMVIDDSQPEDDTSFEVPSSPEEPDEEYNDFGTSSDDQHIIDTQPRIRDEDLWLEDKQELERLALFRNDLRLPLRLYIMADKYDVPALRLLARDKFYRTAELIWRIADSFPDVVDELYSSTCKSDVALREIVCRLVGTNLLEEEVREKMRPVMEKHGEFATGTTEYLIHSMKGNLKPVIEKHSEFATGTMDLPIYQRAPGFRST